MRAEFRRPIAGSRGAAAPLAAGGNPGREQILPIAPGPAYAPGSGAGHKKESVMLWNSSYETAIASVDEQHKELLRQVDILLDTTQSDRAEATLNFLGQYVVKHFAHEESLQAKSRYPKAAEHKKLHTDLIATYKELRADMEKNPAKQGMHVMKISRILMQWLAEHIKGADKEFAQYYKQQA